MATIDPVRLLKRYYPWLIVAGVVGGIVGVAAHLILARVTPFYTATATFACQSPQEDIRKVNSSGVNADDFMRFVNTQSAIMTSTTVLENALRDPELEKSKWADNYRENGKFQPQSAQRALMKALSAKPQTSTYLIRLSMSYSDQDAVRTVVQAVANSYLEEYRKSNNTQSVGRRDALNKQITALDQSITDATRARDRQMTEYNVSDYKNSSTSGEDVKTMRLNESLVNVSRDLSTTKSLLERYEQELTESLVINYPEEMRAEAQRDPVLASLDQQASQYRTEERSLLRQGYGSEHASVVQIRKRIESTTDERNDYEAKVLRKLFDAELDKLRTQKSALESQNENLTKEMETVSKRKEDLARLRVRLDQLENDIQRYTLERTDLVNARNQIETLLGGEVFSRVALIQPAQRPTEMSFPQLQILVPAGIMLSLLLVGGVLVLREILDQRVKGPADVAMIPRLRVLGMVPDSSEDPVKAANVETAFRDAPQGVVAESFRQLRTPIMRKMDQEGFRTLLVLSGMPSSGATTIVSNLALACAGAGERVLLIDANLRRPAIHRVFGQPEVPGLGDCLANQAMLSEAIHATSMPGLSVLPAGSMTNRMLPERLSSEAMTRLLAEAASRFDRILIDAPPAIVSGDGLSLANKCDAIVLVIRAMGEKRGLVNRLRLQMGEVRGEFLGVIVNAVRSSAGGYFKKNIQATHEYQASGR